MAEADKTIKIEPDATVAPALLVLASQTPISKPALNNAQAWTGATTSSAETNSQNKNEARDTSEVHVKKEPGTENEADDEIAVQNVVAEDPRSNSDVVQPLQDVKQEQNENENISSSTVTKNVTDSRPRTTLENVALSSADGEQVGINNKYQQNEEDDDLDSEESSDTELEDENDSDFDCSEDEDRITTKVTKTAAEEPSRKRAAPAKTAREFIARLHKKQDEAAQKKQKKRRNKRKAEATDGEASKRSKTTNTSSGSNIFASLTHQVVGGFDGDEPPVSMPEIDANTHQKQFALLRDSIPKGADTRRTKTQNRDLREAVKLFGYRKVKAMSGNWLLQGMETALYGYQLTAAAWMVKRECARAQPFGGLIADEMGIGKTITSLACVVGNPPEAEDLETYTKGTLVIVPNFDIANQWLKEVKKHCSDDIRKFAMIHQSKNHAPAASYKNLMIV
ncbi:hypothetical protein J3458_019093 [Metarhizium acridum]|uniref:uncharacterized protein n=1 Tax=Metarhizium acridum TaxID=92637 RepID=UPI001C6CFD99|nr:hypothetical protein J3458_019093 [Metarhizium acridum]